jgi:hypothetical protein
MISKQPLISHDLTPGLAESGTRCTSGLLVQYTDKPVKPSMILFRVRYLIHIYSDTIYPNIQGTGCVPDRKGLVLAILTDPCQLYD